LFQRIPLSKKYEDPFEEEESATSGEAIRADNTDETNQSQFSLGVGSKERQQFTYQFELDVSELARIANFVKNVVSISLPNTKFFGEITLGPVINFPPDNKPRPYRYCPNCGYQLV
jgi:hypothetical protein